MDEILNKFITESLKNEPKQWAELRKFDLNVLKEIGIGYADNEVYTTLIRDNKEGMVKSQLITGGRFKYVNCVILKVNEDYFIAKPPNTKNLFLKGTKHPFYIKGTDKTCYVTEGETDAIRLKHIFPESSIFSLGGATSIVMLNQLPQEEYKKIIFAFDNDEAGKEALPKAASKIKQNSFELQFNEKFKDIDEYFKGGGKKEDLKLVEVKVMKKETTNKSIRLIKIKQGVDSGTRNNAAFKLAIEYVNKGIEPEEINVLMKDWNNKNSPPLNELELINCINSAYSTQNRQLKEKETKKQSILGLKIDNFQDNVGHFWKINPFFYDETNIFWFWIKEEYKWKMVDDVFMMSLLDKRLGFCGQTVSSSVKSNYLEAFKRVGRDHKPKPAPTKWVQFKDKAISLRSGNMYGITPDYFFTNPIPWEFGKSEDTPIMDKLIVEWVGEEFKETAYEIIAYCCYSDYPIHIILCLVGCGRNGKSKFLGLINKFIGKENICSTELDVLLDSRFESFKLFKKLVCTMGETNFGVISKTSLLKKLTGQDLIGFEYKQKKPFDDYNYAKIIISSNSLPPSEDTSEGFYRRWLILDFPNIFPEGKDILKTIPDVEYNNLALKISKILPKLLEKGKFNKQGTIKERMEKYIMASNPLSFFIKEHCKRGYDCFMRYSELYVAYRKYLHSIKRRKIGYKEFNDVLTMEGFEVVKTSKKVGEEFVNGRFIEGLELVTIVPLMLQSDTTTLTKEINSELQHKRHKEHNSLIEEEPIFETIHADCTNCGTKISNIYDEQTGNPYCETCYKAKEANK